jgi:hypothetical protein
VRIAIALLVLLATSACGGGGSSAPPPPPPPANRAPAFTSAAAVDAPENISGIVYQAAAADPDGNPLSFSIAGGADAARFTITSAGALSFASPPDFEQPTDADRNNVYLVHLSVSDGSLSATLDLAVTVTNVAGESFAVRRLAAGLSQPVYVAPIPGEARVFVLERGGRILLLDPASSAAPALFMSVAGTISTNGERGLLGLAAAPDYQTSGIFYLYVTDPEGDIEIRRYTRLNADQGNAGSADIILTIPHRQFSNHNGGWLGFGPDGFLYLATGDGGGAGDPLNNAQNLGSLLGKILRIDVRSDAFPADPNRDYAIPPDNPGFAAGEVYAYGLRNPFRASFDGDNLLIGDVGQGAIEEIDLLRRADAGGNYGWPFLEGTRPFRGGAPAGTKAPVTEYEHGTGPLQGQTVTGGYVYRGPALALRGLYIFGDFIIGNIWSIPASDFSQGTTLPTSRFTRRNGDFAPDLGVFNNVVSFGEDSQRNLFIVDFDGEIFMIQPRQ